MDKGKLTQRQRRAYSYAAIATAIYVSKMITIGPIDLDDYDYRSAKLIEFRTVLSLGKQIKSDALETFWPRLLYKARPSLDGCYILLSVIKLC
jgi:hypothetical protein